MRIIKPDYEIHSLVLPLVVEIFKAIKQADQMNCSG